MGAGWDGGDGGLFGFDTTARRDEKLRTGLKTATATAWRGGRRRTDGRTDVV